MIDDGARETDLIDMRYVSEHRVYLVLPPDDLLVRPHFSGHCWYLVNANINSLIRLDLSGSPTNSQVMSWQCELYGFRT